MRLRRAAHGLAVLVALVVVLSGCQPTTQAGARNKAADRFPVAAGSVVGFYGDSMTFGVGATAPERRWATLLCAAEGWSEVNPSIPGLGFLQARGATDLPAQLLAASPDLVIVTLGLNDLWLVDARGDEVRAAIDADLARLRQGAPEAHLVVLALFSPATVEPPQVTTINGWLRSAAEAVDAVYITKSARWLDDRSADWTIDGIHFNDAGNAAIASLLDAELRRVL